MSEWREHVVVLSILPDATKAARMRPPVSLLNISLPACPYPLLASRTPPLRRSLDAPSPLQ